MLATKASVRHSSETVRAFAGSGREIMSPVKSELTGRRDSPLFGDPEQTGSPDDEVLLDVSIVMPCLNEAHTLAACIGEAKEALESSSLRGEIIVADNGSSDGSRRLACSLGARVVHVEPLGYGSALRGGISASKGHFVVFADCDGSYDFGHVPRIIEKLREGNDLVLGNRFLGGISKGAMPWKHRFIGNPVLTGIGRFLFHCPVGDFHCGLRGFRRSAFEQLDLNTTGMEFASEMVVKAQLQGLKIAEVPTVLRPDRRDRAPHLRSWRDGWRHLRFMLLLSPRWLFLIPGCLLAALGFALMLVVAVGNPANIGRVGLSINTSIAGAMLIVVGCQLAMTGVFARTLATRIGALPPARNLPRWSARVTLEHGIAVGVAIVTLGTLLVGCALWIWGNTGFGDLNATLTVRLMVPAMTLVTLGAQLTFESFLFGVFGLACNRSEPVATTKVLTDAG